MFPIVLPDGSDGGQKDCTRNDDGGSWHKRPDGAIVTAIPGAPMNRRELLQSGR
jgi:hypothetical protein